MSHQANALLASMRSFEEHRSSSFSAFLAEQSTHVSQQASFLASVDNAVVQLQKASENLVTDTEELRGLSGIVDELRHATSTLSQTTQEVEKRTNQQLDADRSAQSALFSRFAEVSVVPECPRLSLTHILLPMATTFERDLGKSWKSLSAQQASDLAANVVTQSSLLRRELDFSVDQVRSSLPSDAGLRY